MDAPFAFTPEHMTEIEAEMREDLQGEAEAGAL